MSARTVLSIVAVCFMAATVNAESDSVQAVAMVKKAAEFIKANGQEKGIKALCDSAGAYVKGELYVFAYDTAGVMAAHPKNAKLIGKNMLEVPDVDGKLFRKDIVETAKVKGSGWVDYTYKNPTTGKVEPKTTYLLKQGGLVLCCGIYKN